VGTAFHFMYLQSFSVKMTIFSFSKVNHKGKRKEKETNKSELSKKIPEQQERVPVSAVYVLGARERDTVKIFCSLQPAGKLVLSTGQPQPVVGAATHVCSLPKIQSLSFTQARFPAV